MKILFFLTTLEKGGAETQCFNLVKNLSNDKNYEIKIISLVSGFYEEEFKKLKIPVTIFSKKIKYSNMLNYVFQVKKEITEFKPDIVHSFLFHPNIILKCSLFFVKKDFKLITSYRSIISKYPMIKHLEKINKNSVDLLICNSFSAYNDVKYLSEEFNKRVIVYNGIQEKEINPKNVTKIKSLYKNKKIILTIGNMRFEKDYPTNILTCKELLKTRKDIIFLYVGSGVDFEKIREYAKKEKVNKYIHFLGRRDDIQDLIAACDVFFLPTLFESQPNVILEAMLYKKPIVTTDIPAMREIKFRGKLVPVGNFEVMAESINNCLINGFNNKDIEINYNIIQKKFLISKMVSKYKKIYNGLF
jgi:glycosyltransferase involved in cell wall biosynthesis